MMTSTARARPRRAGRAPGPAGETGALATARAFLDLTKPGITRLVTFTAAVSFYLGSGREVDWLLLLNLVFGTALVASGANAFNQYVERGPDARMRRTAGRPLPAGRLGAGEAFIFATAISFIGTVHLFFLVNRLAAVIVVASLLSYVLVYTPLKRKTWWATLVGSLPGALPALAGWAAATNSIDAGGLAIFAIVLIWQMPHFFALGWMYREDYERGGFRLLSSVDPTGARTARQTLLYAVALLPVSLLPVGFGVAGWLYAAGAVALGLLFLGTAIVLQRDLERGHARRVFLASIVYLPGILVLMLADRLL